MSQQRSTCHGDDGRGTSRARVAGRTLGIALAIFAFGSNVATEAIARFSSGMPGSLPSGWHVHAFHHVKPTRYRLVLDHDRFALQADSRDSASALITEADVDVARTPWIEWSWRIDHVMPHARWGGKRTDDFPARVFVIFADAGRNVTTLLSDALAKTDASTRALNYVWANDGIAGRTGPSPYTDNVMMIAVEAGAAKSRSWVAERRNVVEDFRRAFHAPPARVRAVAVMTDTDNTHTQQTALYGDVRFASASGPGR